MKFSIFFLFIICLVAGCKNDRLETVKINGTQIPINQIYYPNASISQFILPYKNELRDEINTILCYNPKTLSRSEKDLESSLGNIYADICYKTADSVFKVKTGKNIDFALFNYGGIRNVIPRGNITVGNIFELLPFENKLVVVELTGTKTQDLLDYLKENEMAHPISGIRLELKGQKFANILIQKEPFDPAKNYFVLTHDYLQHGGDNMSFFKDPVSLFTTPYKVRDVLIDYLAKIDTLHAFTDERFIKY